MTHAIQENDMKQTEHNLMVIEYDLLLEGIFRQYGYDFREYARVPLHRRILKCVRDENFRTISGLLDCLLHEESCMERCISTFTMNVTTLYREPEFFLSLRKNVVPLLRTYPHVRVWIAGCSSGEEVYSLAIMLHEEGLLEKSTIYATDINEQALGRAKEGIYPLDLIHEYTENYVCAGGTAALSDYYSTDSDSVTFNRSLRKNMVFAQHNLATDASFNEFTLIICRDVMISFNRGLANRVHKLIYDSLVPFGLLGIGRGERLNNTGYEFKYTTTDENLRIYKRVGE